MRSLVLETENENERRREGVGVGLDALLRRREGEKGGLKRERGN